MKKILLIISTFSFIAYPIYSQNSSNNSEFNEQQTHFIEFMKALYHEHRNRPNDLEPERFDRKMTNYLDSIQPLIGWKGAISLIGMKDSVLSFHIEFNSHEFVCGLTSYFKYETKKELKNYHIYNKLINIPNGSTIYFDGYLRGTVSCKIINFEFDDVIKFLRPQYALNPFEIYVTQPESFSSLLRETLFSSCRRYVLTFERFYNLITDIEYKESIDALPEINSESLTHDEIEYHNRCIGLLDPFFLRETGYVMD